MPKEHDAPKPVVRGIADVPENTRHGVDLRILLSPATAGSTSGFMGVATVRPGESVKEHYHPYSEEFLYVVSGGLTAELDGNARAVSAGQGVFIPIGVRHRLVNEGEEDAFIVFSLSPLAPRPELGHVSTNP